MNDETILQDYYLMEDGNRFLGTGNRGAAIPADNKRRKQQYPNRLKKLMKETKAQNIHLELLPCVFDRAKANTSKVQGNENTIMWTVEWVFELSEARYIQHGLSNAVTLGAHLHELVAINPDTVVRRNRLKPYLKPGSDAYDHLGVYMKSLTQPANQPKFHALDLNTSLASLLAGKTIQEFPTFYVKAPSEKDADFLAMVLLEPAIAVATPPAEQGPGGHALLAGSTCASAAASAAQSKDDSAAAAADSTPSTHP